jgi:hypothetical protein
MLLGPRAGFETAGEGGSVGARDRGCLATPPPIDQVGTESQDVPIFLAGVGENSPQDMERTAVVGSRRVDILVLRQPLQTCLYLLNAGR